MGADPRFKHHTPLTLERRKVHEDVRCIIAATASVLEQTLPPGRERSIALTKIEEAMFWANASVARAPYPTEETPDHV